MSASESMDAMVWMASMLTGAAMAAASLKDRRVPTAVGALMDIVMVATPRVLLSPTTKLVRYNGAVGFQFEGTGDDFSNVRVDPPVIVVEDAPDEEATPTRPTRPTCH